MTRRLLLSLLAALLLHTSCAATDVGNPQDDDFDTTISFALNDSRVDKTDQYKINNAWFVFERIRLIESETCTNEASVDLAGPVVVALGDTDPWTSPVFTQKSGSFCRVGMLLTPTLERDALPDNAPDSLIKASVVVQGQRADGTPFEIQSALDDKLKLDALMNAFTLKDKTMQRLFVLFDAGKWLDNAELNALAPPSSGSIIISTDDNTTLFTTFKDALSKDVQLVVDGDGDGELSDTERSTPIADGGLVPR